MVHQLAGTGTRGPNPGGNKRYRDGSRAVSAGWFGGAVLGARFLHVAHELSLGDTVIEAKLLLFFETDGVFGALATGLAVLTGGIGPFGGLPGETGRSPKRRVILRRGPR